jgi:hypothetical protein
MSIPTQDEGFVIEGNCSIMNDYGNPLRGGSLEVFNTIFTDKLSPYTLGAGISIFNTDNISSNTSASVVFYGGTSFLKESRFTNFIEIQETSQPTAPQQLYNRLYLDSSTKLLSILDSSNTLSTLNPLTTLGDILIHNGTTETRLPVGSDGLVLSADSSAPSGLVWVSQGSTNNSNTGTGNSNSITLIGNGTLTSISNNVTGSYYNQIGNRIARGPCCNYMISKSRYNIPAAIARITFCNGITSQEKLTVTWPSYEEPEISKNGVNYDGDYDNNTFENVNSSNVVLSGVSWTTVFTELIGNYLFTVNNDIDGPVATFVASKNNAGQVGGGIARLSHSPDISNTSLIAQWGVNSGIQIRKNGTSSDGTYIIRDLTNLTTNKNIQVTLTGTSPSIINYKYQRLTTTLSITTATSGGPYAVFIFSKNDRTIAGSITRIIQSAGSPSGEQLFLTWNSESSLSLYKNGTGFNGVYNLSFVSN